MIHQMFQGDTGHFLRSIFPIENVHQPVLRSHQPLLHRDSHHCGGEHLAQRINLPGIRTGVRLLRQTQQTAFPAVNLHGMDFKIVPVHPIKEFIQRFLIYTCFYKPFRHLSTPSTFVVSPNPNKQMFQSLHTCLSSHSQKQKDRYTRR